MNIDKKYVAIIKEISQRFKVESIENNWIIAGGIAQKVNGLHIVTNDIDIITVPSIALKMDATLNDFCVQPMKESGNNQFHSTFGKYIVDGILVEIAGGLIVKNGSIKYLLDINSYLLNMCKKSKINGIDIFLNPLRSL